MPNPLDLFVENRVIALVYENSRPYYSFQLPIHCREFTEQEVISINLMLMNPTGYGNEGYGHRCIWESASTWGARDSCFVDGMYALAKRAVHYFISHELMYVSHSGSQGNIPLFAYTFDSGHHDEEAGEWNDLYARCHDDENVLLWKEDCVFGVVDGHGERAWFLEEDYVCDNYQGTYYINDEVAQDNDVYWQECCEQYWPNDASDSCCNEGGNTTGESFDDSFKDTYKEEELTFLNLTKVSGMDYTFGVELETQNSSGVYSNGTNMRAVYDGSTEGLEFVSGVLQGNKGVTTVQDMCEHLQNCDAKIDRKCGVHVHVGGAEFNRRFSIIVLKLCLDIEDDMYKLLPESRQGNSFCKLLPRATVEQLNLQNYRTVLGQFVASRDIGRDYNKKKGHPGGRYNSQRYYWVNITNYSTDTGTNTIEFRPHAGSLDFKKIYNWLLICMSIVKFAENKQRRVWTSSMSERPVTLKEVLKYSLNDKLYNQVYGYCLSRAKQFGKTLS